MTRWGVGNRLSAVLAASISSFVHYRLLKLVPAAAPVPASQTGSEALLEREPRQQDTLECWESTQRGTGDRSGLVRALALLQGGLTFHSLKECYRRQSSMGLLP